MDRVTHFFDTHPLSNECFETADGFVFHERQNADAHSFSLKTKTVTEHKRSELANNVTKETIALAKSLEESRAITESKDAELMQSVAAGKTQKEDEEDIAAVASEIVKDAVTQAEGQMADEQDRKNNAAILGNATAAEGAGDVKTTTTPPEYLEKEATKKDLKEFPELKEQGVKVGDTIQVPK